MTSQSYLLLDAHGEPLDLIEGSTQEALNAAYAWDPSGRIYLDAPTEQNFESIEAGEQLALAANPPKLRVVGRGPAGAPGDALRAVAAAMKRDPERLIDYEAATHLSLDQAHRTILPFFPTQKVFESGEIQAVHYDEPMKMVGNLLGQNYKTAKNTPKNIIRKLRERTGFSKANVLGLSLLPSTQSYTETMVKQIMADATNTYGVASVRPVRLNACVRATPECASSCLAFSGRNLADDYNTVKKYSLLQALVHEPEAFVRVLWESIRVHRDKSYRAKVMPLVRLNVFSDLPWELMVPSLFRDFPDVQFYDYTKVPGRVVPENYDLTFSFAGTESNVEAMDTEIREHRRRIAVVFAATNLKRMYEISYQEDGRTTKVRTSEGRRVARVRAEHGEGVIQKLGLVEAPVKPTFRRKPPGGKSAVRHDAKLPEEFLGLSVIDGDESDMRPYDAAPTIVGLRWKTPANQGVTLEEAKVFIVQVDVVPSGGGYHHCIVSKTARFDDVDYGKYAADLTDR